jgi:hypothetical protein
MVKRASYGYTIAEGKDSTPYKRTLSDKESETFDEDRVRNGQGMLVNSATPDRKAMRYMGDFDKQEDNLDVTGAGAGRGTQGTEKKASGGAVKKMASGGKVSSASSRADGIAQRGKTRGKMC